MALRSLPRRWRSIYHQRQGISTLAQVLEVKFEGGSSWQLHPLLLRERAGPAQSSTGQRLFEIVDKVRETGGQQIRSCALANQGQTLDIEFVDGVRGSFGFKDLCGQVERLKEGELPQRELWRKSSLDIAHTSRFDAAQAARTGTERQLAEEVAQQLLTYGIAVIRNITPQVGSGPAWLGKHLGTVRDTHWGHSFHVKVEPKDHDDLAYTNEPIDLHVDNPYRRPVPGYWCLHALSMGAGTGGDSLACDGLAVSQRLREEYPEGFDALTRVKVGFRYADDQVHLFDSVPHIILSPCGSHIGRITYSGRLDEVPLTLSPAEAELYYKARARWLTIAREDAVQFKLKPGELIILDNERVMHGRTTIVPSPGERTPRHLEGCYIDKDGVTGQYFASKARQRHSSLRATEVRLRHSVPVTELTSARTGSHTLPGFSSLIESSPEQVLNMAKECSKASTPDMLVERALRLLRAMDTNETFGAQVNIYEHSLQSASRALRAGEKEDVVCAALLHDVGELLSPSSHGEIPAAILAPYVSPQTHWILANHEVFQMHYYAHHLGMDRDARNKLVGHEHYEACRHFCETYDAPSFDPTYANLPLESFLPILKNVFSRDPYWWNLDHPKRGAVTGRS